MVNKSFTAITAIVFFVIMIIIASCSNPAIIKLMDQVETDVAV